MREIKFRAWDGVQKEWQYLYLERGGVRFKYQNRTPYPQDCEMWMQYTGLKDKNGREIYEGDLIDCFDTSGEKVYYTPQEVKLPEWYKLIWDETNTEVVGNIYENQDLLTKK